MLDRAHRLTSSAGFVAAVRRGRRAGSRTLVVHLGVAEESSPSTPETPASRIGFVVSKAVGNAVVRNRVKRRLRHLARERVDTLPGSRVLVVRALPPAADASYAALAADLDGALARVLPGVSTGTRGGTGSLR